MKKIYIQNLVRMRRNGLVLMTVSDLKSNHQNRKCIKSVGIDIGSSRIATIIAAVSEEIDEKVKVVGVSSLPSKGN